MAEVRSITQAFNHVYQAAPIAGAWMGRKVTHLSFAGVITLLLVSVIGLIYRQVTYHNRIVLLKGQAAAMTNLYKTSLRSPSEDGYQSLLVQLKVYPAELGSMQIDLEAAHQQFAALLVRLTKIQGEVREFLDQNDFQNDPSLLRGGNFNRLKAKFDEMSTQLRLDPDNTNLTDFITQFEERKQLFVKMRQDLIQSPEYIRDKIVEKAKWFLEQNDFLQNLSLIKGESGKEIGKQFNELALELEPYTKDQDVKSWIFEFNELKTTFSQMREHRQELFHIPIVFQPNGTIKTIDNGNCFYEAVAKSLDLTRGPSTLETSVYSTRDTDVRKAVVHWMRCQLATDLELQNKIRNTIWTILCDLDEQIAQELKSIQALEREGHSQTEARRQLEQRKLSFEPYRQPNAFAYYLDQQAKDKAWGSNAEAYAAAQMYLCSIEIIGVNRMGNGAAAIDAPIPDLRDSIFPGRLRTIRLKFIQNRHHYEPYIGS